MGTTDFAIGRWLGRFDGVPLERDGLVAQGAVGFGGSVGGVRVEPELDGLAQCVVGLGGDGLLDVEDALELGPVVIDAVLLELVADSVDDPVGEHAEEQVRVAAVVLLVVEATTKVAYTFEQEISNVTSDFFIKITNNCPQQSTVANKDRVAVWNVAWESAISGVEDLNTDDINVTEIARYTLDGRMVSAPVPGINIVRYSNGETRKEVVR